MDMMTEQEFDTLWQRAEANPHANRLIGEYPVWRRNRRNGLGITATLLAAALAVLSLTTGPDPAGTDSHQTVAFCNRPDIADQYWVEMADALLLEACETKNTREDE